MIWTLCSPNLEFQLVNPTTQVALFSRCAGDCPTIQNITWNIYEGMMNSSSNFTQWTLFDQMNDYENIWFYGEYHVFPLEIKHLLFSQVTIQVILHQQINYFLKNQKQIFGNLKLYIHLKNKQVLVHCILKSIQNLQMEIVQLIL